MPPAAACIGAAPVRPGEFSPEPDDHPVGDLHQGGEAEADAEAEEAADLFGGKHLFSHIVFRLETYLIYTCATNSTTVILSSRLYWNTVGESK